MVILLIKSNYFLILLISSVTVDDLTFNNETTCLLSIFNALLPNSNTNPIVITIINNKAIVNP